MQVRFICHGERDTSIQTETLPPVNAGEILVKTAKTLVSVGTELEYLRGTGNRKRMTGKGGYLNVGNVMQIGPAVEEFKIGDRVFAFAPHVSHYVVPASGLIFHIPDGVTDGQGVFTGLGAIAMHLVERAEVSVGRTVVVVGQGTVGLLVAQIARIAGAGFLVGVDLNEQRLVTARRLGADAAIQPDAEALKRSLVRATNGACPPVFIEVSGSSKAAEWCIANAPRRSRVVLAGTYAQAISFDPFDPFIERELDVVGAHQPKCPEKLTPYYPYCQRFNNAFVLDRIRAGVLKVDGLTDGTLTPDEAVAFYNAATAGKQTYGQPLINWEG